MNIKEKDLADLIKSKIHQKNPDAEVILFGSHARGEASVDSDWDILILINGININRQIERAFRDQVFDVELEVGEPISTFVYTRNDWETKYCMTPLYNNIKREGIRL